jgi:signal transduction histidine kinase
MVFRRFRQGGRRHSRGVRRVAQNPSADGVAVDRALLFEFNETVKRMSPLDPEPVNTKKVRKALIRAVLVPATLLFVLAATFIFQTNHLLRLSRYVAHTENILREAFETQKLILDMETGVRGFLIHKDAIFLTPYLKSKEEIGAHLDALDRLVAHDLRNVRRVAEVRILLKGWMDIIEVRFKGSAALSAESRPRLAREAKLRMDRIRVNFDRIIRDSEAIRNERRSSVETAARRSLRFGIALAIVLGGIVAFVTFGQVQLISNTFLKNLRALREAKTELEKSHELLEEKVQERTLALTAANRELEAFCYSVSHDLRSPLRGIDGFAQAIVEDYEPVLDPQGRKYLEFIRSGVQRMGRLIDDLLALSRLTRVEMRVASVDMSALAEEIVQRFREESPKRSVEVRIEKGLVVTADPGLISIALENLLSNAWKFTSKSDNPLIEFGSMMDEAGEKLYFIRDNGAGFDMAFSEKLFGAFQRLHANSEFEGTGIGLATVRRIIHRHGGHIHAQGEVRKGAAFFFTLPGPT